MDAEWLMRAPPQEIAKRALEDLDKHCDTDAARLEMMTAIINAVREGARAEAIDKLAALVPTLFSPPRAH